MSAYNIALGNARSLGLFSQIEPEQSHPSIPTLLSAPAPGWVSLLDPPSSRVYRDYIARIERVRLGFSKSHHCGRPRRTSKTL